MSHGQGCSSGINNTLLIANAVDTQYQDRNAGVSQQLAPVVPILVPFLLVVLNRRHGCEASYSRDLQRGVSLQEWSAQSITTHRRRQHGCEEKNVHVLILWLTFLCAVVAMSILLKINDNETLD